MNQKKIVCVGGGTGLSTMLRGLKKHTTDLVAIVTVADNGGSSGDLRKDLNVLPPGDIRNCLLALAESEPVLQTLFQHRFSEGNLKGHNLGNLIIAGMADMVGHFGKAVEMVHEVLRVNGQVLPVTLEDVQLEATYDDGSTVVGECEIVAANKSHRKRIRQMALIPNQPKVYKHVLEAIGEADIVVLGPGSLYTSIIPNLLVDGVCDAIRAAKGKIVYVGNIMTQPGETDGFTLIEHVRVVEEYLGEGVIDYIIANDSWPDSMTIEHYNQDGAELVLPLNQDDRIIAIPLVKLDEEKGYVRHHTNRLAEAILHINE